MPDTENMPWIIKRQFERGNRNSLGGALRRQIEPRLPRRRGLELPSARREDQICRLSVRFPEKDGF